MRPKLLELLPELHLFAAVAQAKSFSKAARALEVPISTLSRRIAELERVLGVQLLVRSTRQVQLSEDGARLLETAREIIDFVEGAEARLGQDPGQAQGILKVSVTQDFARTYLSETFVRLAARHPQLSIELDLTARTVDLIAEGVDVAIRMGKLADSQLYARKIGASTLGLFASPAYLATHRPLKVPRDLESHSCLRILGRSSGATRWTLRRNDEVEVVMVQGRFVANSMRFVTDLAALGLGIACVDIAVAEGLVERGELVRVLPKWSASGVPVHALMPSKLIPLKTRVFLDCLREGFPKG